MGDEREGVGAIKGKPEISWIKIPTGPFTFQENQRINQPSFEISKYPITYSQFEPFIEEGYSSNEFWSTEGLTWRGERRHPQYYWVDSRWHIGNHPVVGLSWYEADAYCKWLAQKLGYEVRLPIETEWEKAARGMDGRIYPFGNDFDENKGNFRETGIGRTTAVGIFVEGLSPYSVMDMSGNVWEWCIREKDLTTTDDREVLRGGSWGYNRVLSTTIYRRLIPPTYNNGYYGFRICR